MMSDDIIFGHSTGGTLRDFNIQKLGYEHLEGWGVCSQKSLLKILADNFSYLERFPLIFLANS